MVTISTLTNIDVPDRLGRFLQSEKLLVLSKSLLVASFELRRSWGVSPPACLTQVDGQQGWRVRTVFLMRSSPRGVSASSTSATGAFALKRFASTDS